MNSVKILHCADLHLDAPLVGLSDRLAAIRQEELRESFGKIVDIAQDRNVDILIISGDLFDRETVKTTTIDYIIQKLRELKDLSVVIAAGNHDCLAKSYYYKRDIWPQNIHIFDDTTRKLDFPRLNTCVYGISFKEAYQETGFLKGFMAEDESKINILAVHGEVVSEGSSSQYNPVTFLDIRESKMDYIALGHVHTFSGINKTGTTFWCYPGTPEGKGFDEKGDKGIVLGEIAKDHCDMEFLPIAKRQYIEQNLDISGMSTYEEIAEKIKTVLDSTSGKNFYKIKLKGEISESFNINIDIIKAKLEDDVFDLKLIDDTAFFIDLNHDLEDDTMKHVFINNMRRKINASSDNEEADLLKRALKIGIYALNGERIDFNGDI